MTSVDKYGISLLVHVTAPVRRRVLHMNLGDGRRIANADIADVLATAPQIVRDTILSALSAPRRRALLRHLEERPPAPPSTDPLAAEWEAMLGGPPVSAAESRLTAALEKAVRDGILVIPEELSDPDALPLWPDEREGRDASHLRLVHDRDSAGQTKDAGPLDLFHAPPTEILSFWLEVADAARAGLAAFDRAGEGVADTYSRRLASLGDDEVSDGGLREYAEAMRSRLIADRARLADMEAAALLSAHRGEAIGTQHGRLSAFLGRDDLPEMPPDLPDGAATRWGQPIAVERIGDEMANYARGLLWFHHYFATRGILSGAAYAEALPPSLFAWGLNLLQVELDEATVARAVADRRAAILADLDSRMRLVETLVIAVRNRLPHEVVLNLAFAGSIDVSGDQGGESPW